MKSIGNLDKVNPVIADESDPDTLAFAKAYLAGNRGDFREGLQHSDRDAAASEKFYARYGMGKTVRSGFAGSGESHYTDATTGRVFSVNRTPNGRTFYGTSHYIEVVA